MKYNVFDNKKFTMDELLEALKANFVGYEAIHNLVANKTPKYGNDDDYADDLMKMVFNYFVDNVSARPNMRGGTYRVDMLPTTCHVYFGDVMIASPTDVWLTSRFPRVSPRRRAPIPADRPPLSSPVRRWIT